MPYLVVAFVEFFVLDNYFVVVKSDIAIVNGFIIKNNEILLIVVGLGKSYFGIRKRNRQKIVVKIDGIHLGNLLKIDCVFAELLKKILKESVDFSFFWTLFKIGLGMRNCFMG